MRKHRVVLLELDPQIAGSYELFLSARGFDVVALSSVAAALRALAAQPCEIAVIGSLPDSIDGGTAARRMRAMLTPRPLAVVAMSPSMDEIEGVDLVIPRGVHPRALLDAIRTLGRRRPDTAPIATAS